MSSFRPSGGARPSSSKGDRKPSGTSSISEVFGDFAHRGHRKSSSFSSRRLSETSARRSEDLGPDALAANNNRWSSSTASSAGFGHRKNSSLSKRFSFSTSTLNSGLRSLSPSKRRRPSDANNDVGPSHPTDALQGSTLPSMGRFSPLNLPSLSSAPPLEPSPRTLPPDASPSSSSSRGGQSSLSYGDESPQQKRTREALHKPGSHLSDIIESDKAAAMVASSRPSQPMPNSNNNSRPVSRRAASRTASSRDPSPMKRPTQATGPSPTPPTRKRSKKDKDKKTMLSKALKRANEAVHLDNEQEFGQAIWAYEEACSLLDSVLARTSTESEKQKLTSIRETYSTRVQDLRQIQSQARVSGGHSANSSSSSGNAARYPLDHISENGGQPASTMASVTAAPGSQESNAADGRNLGRVSSGENGRRQRGYENVYTDYQDPSLSRGVADPASRPPPLSPNLSPSQHHVEPGTPVTATQASFAQRESGVVGLHTGRAMRDTGSWFVGGQDEAASGGNSPTHSMNSMEGIRRRDIRGLRSDTEAEFDAALEAAIESAYDGYDPYSANEVDPSTTVRETAPLQTRNPIEEQAHSYNMRQANIKRLSRRSRSIIDPDLALDFSDGGSGIDSDEEDRLLDAGRDIGLARGPGPETQMRPAIPRQSDSSGYSNQTWASSATSSVNTGATSLGTVDENPVLPTVTESAHSARGSLSPQAVPPVPGSGSTSPSRGPQRDILTEKARGESPLRDRRFSGHGKAKNLRIETQVPSGRRTSDATTNVSPPKVPEASKLAPVQPPLPVRGASRLDPGSLACPYPSPNVAAFQTGTHTPTTPNFAKPVSAGSLETSPTGPSQRQPAKPDRPSLLNNGSSLSLSKQAQLGIRTPDGTDPSPDTPMSFGFSSILTPPERQDSRLGQPLSTPMDSTFGSLSNMGSAQMAIFDHEIHSVTLPGSPNPAADNGPKAIEPCPDAALLRPFWMLRCIQQTLVHPKGGYFTTRLFVPHDVWTAKTAKLKYVEEKIANCDLLTAALLKLSGVNTEDADAVLEEMQGLEAVLDQLQAAMGKRLGNEVGSGSLQNLFKSASSATSPTSGDPNATDSGSHGNTTSTGSKTGSKSYLNSWRKLRSKGSSTNLPGSNKDGQRDQVTSMASVPMTSNNDVKIRNRTKQQQALVPRAETTVMEGPNANYMSALIRLCEATQILDQISRQAEDPGLKFTNQTHVGLELSARHASDFFGFYVCRFILNDMSLLADKYVKRSSEWAIT